MLLKSKRTKLHRHHFNELGIYVFESRHSANFVMEIDKWDFHKLCIVVKGEGFIETFASQKAIRDGQLIYLPAGLEHRFADRKNNPLTLALCCFYDRAFDSNEFAQNALAQFRQTISAALPYSLHSNYHRVEIMENFKQMMFEQVYKKVGAEALIFSRLLETIVVLTRTYQEAIAPDGNKQAAFAACLNYLDDNFYRPLKIEDLARLANMSYRRFTENFKQTKQKTVTQYISEIRIEYAKKIMLQTEDILYTCFESGFGDLAHFYRVFKKLTGLTPKQFIDLHKE